MKAFLLTLTVIALLAFGAAWAVYLLAVLELGRVADALRAL